MLTNPRDALRGQSRSPNMVSFDMLGMVSYYFACFIDSVADKVKLSGVGCYVNIIIIIIINAQIKVTLSQ